MIKMMFKWTKWLSLSLIGLLLLLIIIVATVLFTHPGLKFALWGAEKALPQLQIEKVQGSLFPRFELHNVSFFDESLNIDAKVERLALAVNFRCFFDPKVCVDELRLQGLDFKMPELPPASEEQEETPPLRSISTPVPIFVNKVSFNDINVNVLGNQIDWQTFSTALSMQGDRLVIAPTALKDINVALAPSEAEPEAAAEEPKETDVTPQDIVLPEVWIPLTVEARRLDIHNFKLAGETPVIVNHLGLVARAGGERVDVKTLELDMPEVEGKLSTQVTLSSNYPIKAQLDALVKQADAKGQKLSLSVSGSVGDLSLNATLSELVQAEIKGDIQLLKTQLPFDVEIKNVQAQWPLFGQSDYQVSVPSLAAKGSLDGYEVALETKASGKDIPAVDVALNGKGTLEQIDLESLVVKTLGGELSGKVMANWAAPINWQADLNLKNIQPGLQWKEAEGDISGNLSTSGSLTEQGGWQVSLPKLDIDGILRGYPLNVEGQLEASDKNGKGEDIQLTTQGLALSHGPNQLSAKGKIDKQILMDVEVNFPDFAKSVPDLAGKMQGKVALRGSLKEPDINLDLALNQINWQQQANVETITLKGDVKPLPAPKANISLIANNITYDDIKVDSADLEVSGDEKLHQLTLDVVSDLVSTSLEIEGTFQQKPEMIWNGALRRLMLSSQQGPWALQKSTAVKVNIDKQIANVQAHCWLQAESSVCLTEDISVGKSGQAKLAINDFDFDQIKQFLPPETKLQGSVNAQAFAKWAPEKKPEVTLSVNMPKGQVEQALEQPIKVGWESFNFKAALAKDKLDAEWLFDVKDNGDLSGKVSLLNVSSEKPTIDGKVSLSTFHLDFLAPLIGEYSLFKANMNTDLAISGDVMHPKVNGQFLIDQMKLQGEVTPIDINSGQVVINFKGHQADLNAGILTPDGELNVTGDADWQDLQNWRTKARVFAKELNVDLPPMVKIKVEPDMTIDVTPQLAKIEGDINLPWGRIVVEELPPSAVGVSSDTVILDKNLQPVDDVAAMPFDVETNINIKIGDDFQLAAFGLKGGLKGNLNVTQKDKGPFIVGEVNVVDGSYRSFGQDLLIKEGKILMNGPPDQPYLSIKAIRNPDNTQDDVIAGVQVSGPASDPSIEIFSEPAMNQANALSYLLRGQDIDGEAGGNAMTTTLIGLSLAKSGRVVGEIGEAFGVQDLQLDTAGSGDDSQVTVSGYILPGLQVKYGVGIFNSLGEFTVRYRLMQDLYLEAVSGVDSAVDLLYQFEFD
ncbi:MULTISPECIES: translocation/assembly module TamB domain-containing protein [Vibrio]|uniref:autotransporter assembly complex protein TamB n=1 Tax=Vibrio TaxID=662 RepID=UPI001CDCA579|nr:MULTISPECIES: translocation/assembly module TamB domain-containing protein [Vibrio]MCA2421786.1 translocation/assembly module TamB [Vibrio alginolyticus]MCA2445020.1 translocation/assembly module TamB [Vibrio alginolyticus]MDW2158199.1 translocation/assembly module TamB domain-containing protein [Vibrio sp. 1942]MDW2181023.1 translocation/assembly module TamB domain-containing protein [Vibrio sp. 1762]MDW2226100.1 translocation/assembly module TamB domain-containing protein [Vibrio sp. 1761